MWLDDLFIDFQFHLIFSAGCILCSFCVLAFFFSFLLDKAVGVQELQGVHTLTPVQPVCPFCCLDSWIRYDSIDVMCEPCVAYDAFLHDCPAADKNFIMNFT